MAQKQTVLRIETQLSQAGSRWDGSAGAVTAPVSQTSALARQDPEPLGGHSDLIAELAVARSQDVEPRLDGGQSSASLQGTRNLMQDVHNALTEARTTSTGRAAPAAGAPQSTRKETAHGQNL